MQHHNVFVFQTLTSHSSIIWVASQTVDIRVSLRAVSKVSLSASAANNVKIYCANPSTKMGITEGNCICWQKCIVNEKCLSLIHPRVADKE